ncbi:hypothetical protein [Arcanobacterium buesumense]|uniref:Uncharacterized protein n=1 Tax=Arcanobacterium buesumense TaxID=2722751 RepID=A0A6H2EHQ3_9ACTO|nr:hypothetical protein [Arcanobacterium buesumense]QJC21095.1 hypothetical protein HC352_00225 [Arcanobacterium buesumense]
MTALFTQTPIQSTDISIELIPFTDEPTLKNTPNLNTIPAVLVLIMLFATVVLGTATSTPFIACAAGITAALVTSVFAFLDLYIRLHQN